MLTSRSISLSFGPREVLRGVDWAVPPGSRWGLVGPNGAGKTTLLRILAGEQEPSGGCAERPGRSSIAYLPQEGGSLPEGTLLEAILSPFTDIARMDSEIRRLHDLIAGAADAREERHAATAAPGEGPGRGAAPVRNAGGGVTGIGPLERQLGELQHRFEAAGGFRIESEAKIILGGLGFRAGDHGRPITEFSGGYRTRALLGSLLLRRPDYLLMDEPTNHLDLEGIQWLEEYIRELPSAIVVVSHDRQFLNRTVTSVAELEHGTITVYRGDYDAYRAGKEARRERASAAAAREEKKAAQVERFVERFRYKATKARQVQDRIRMLGKMERTEVPGEEAGWRFRLQVPSRPPAVVLELTGVTKGYGGEPVLKEIDLTVARGERVALVGPNGCGKTTLLRVALGELAPEAGEVRTGDKVIVRQVAQHLVETLTAGRTVLEELQALAPSARQGDLRSLLGLFQFSGDDAFKDVAALSGGEKNRLALARLALQPGHLLLLDEPTNHLDFAAREALEEALLAFEGSVLFVSHDRYFINRVAQRVVGFEEGRLRSVEGGFDAWMASLREATRDAAGAGSGADRQGDRERRRDERRGAAETRNVRNRALRELTGRVEAIEAEIAGREARVGEIRAVLAEAETYRTPGLAESLGREEKALSAELRGLFDRWEQAGRELEEFLARNPQP